MNTKKLAIFLTLAGMMFSSASAFAAISVFSVDSGTYSKSTGLATVKHKKMACNQTESRPFSIKEAKVVLISL